MNDASLKADQRTLLVLTLYQSDNVKDFNSMHFAQMPNSIFRAKMCYFNLQFCAFFFSCTFRQLTECNISNWLNIKAN